MVKDKVLIADDSLLNQGLLSAILGNQYDYLYAKNGLEVINILNKNETVNIILLDINMPQVGGFEVLKFMNEKHYIEHIPVVIISVEDDGEFIRKAYELGATDYITRPYNSVVVSSRVKNTLMLYSNQKRLVKLVENQILEREKINNAMINIFSNIIEMRNHESGSHTIHVQSITNIILHELVNITDKYKLTGEDISLISSLAALHDIGKISVPESIINKPGKLTPEEWVIMKEHTVEGYNILSHANIDQDGKFMTTAKAICRWHHEKYDGKGYPDGLAGDHIPISAQVVSMADVYDALTSERCYKKAFSHEQAISMILNGECGTFNPILLDCLKNVSNRLEESLKVGITRYDYQNESFDLTNEILSSNDLPTENMNYLLENESLKREFFESVLENDIQFEYDLTLHKVRLVNSHEQGEKRCQIFYSSENKMKLLSDDDWVEFKRRIRNTTRDNPEVTMNVLLSIDGQFRWHKLTAKTLWSEKGNEYIAILGHFSDIHEKVLNCGFNKLFPTGEFKNALESLRAIFPIVRIVNPKNCHVLSINEQGDVIDTNVLCSKLWNRDKPCEYCSSARALACKSWNKKVEYKDEKSYYVLSKYIKLKDMDCVLEVAFCIDVQYFEAQKN